MRLVVTGSLPHSLLLLLTISIVRSTDYRLVVVLHVAYHALGANWGGLSSPQNGAKDPP